MKQNFFIGFFVILVIVTAVLYFLPRNEAIVPAPTDTGTPPPPPVVVTPPPPQPANDQQYADEVRIELPQPNTVVQSPLHVKGKAKGVWFFEANIPVSILDANKNVIVRQGFRATGDWMTTDFVGFEGDIPFTLPVLQPGIYTGYLQIQNDNPSGLPQNAKSFLVPIRFSQSSSNLLPAEPTQAEYDAAKKLSKDKCPCWDGVHNICLPQSVCM